MSVSDQRVLDLLERFPALSLSPCRLCPRECGVDRLHGQLGFCQSPGRIRAARAALLAYEEPCLVGEKGSGAVFFTGCSMGCIFCQNREISLGERGNVGLIVSPEHLSEIFLSLQEEGAATLNLVTASHYLPLIIPALLRARDEGLSIPVVYNTSAYEKVEPIRALEGLIDIYLPDLKFMDPALAKAWCQAPDYFTYAFAAIEEMVRQRPLPLFSDGSHTLEEGEEEGGQVLLMKEGVIVRHLCMPGQVEDSKRILAALHERFGDQIFISIMNQYTPMPQVAGVDPLLERALTSDEYEEVVDFALSIGIENGFLQEGETVSESFIPVFDGTGLT